jgi:hypothetical protein
MIARFRLLIVLSVLLGASTAGLAVPPNSHVSDQPIAPGGPDLKTTLEKGLLARRPVELEFIKRVVWLVNHGKIPISVVETNFLYARRKGPYPMPYFMKTMEIRAQQLGVEIKIPIAPSSP